jgi:hypothetical protein
MAGPDGWTDASAAAGLTATPLQHIAVGSTEIALSFCDDSFGASGRDGLLQAAKGAITQEQDVGGVARRNSCWGRLRAPCGGTEAIVPSVILSSACWTLTGHVAGAHGRLRAVRGTR